MRRSMISLILGLIGVISAKPAFLPVPSLTYSAAPVIPGIIANDGTLNGRPEVTVAGTPILSRERVNPATRFPRGRQSYLRVDDDAPTASPSSAPLGVDGRVVDTAEVTAAKAAHATAHANERVKLALEAARSSATSSEIDDEAVEDGGSSEATIGPNGRILDTPEVAAARAAHAIAHVNEEINLANEIVRSSDAIVRLPGGIVVPLVLGNGVVAALLPVGVDDRSLDTPEIAAHGNRKLENKPVKSVDALAVAGPALAYGRLIY